MRAVVCVIVGSCAWLCEPLAASAADWPAIVIPGKRGVPVMINGIDASYAIVEGDYGLDRPQQVPLTIIPRWPYTPPPGTRYSEIPGNPPHYYPGDGRHHGYGRLEVVPPSNRPKPPPAESYSRGWSAGSDPLPADTNPPSNNNFDVTPNVWGGWDGRDRHRDRDRRRPGPRPRPHRR